MGCLTNLVLISLGWTFGGPIGAILGGVLGGVLSNRRPRVIHTQVNEQLGDTEPKRDFNVSLLVLSAAVMKADGSVKKSELEYVKRFFVQNFGQTRAENDIKMLRSILEQDYNIYDVSMQVGRNMNYSSRLQLLHYLFGIAAADGYVSDSESDVIHIIAQYMSITEVDYQSVKAMFVRVENKTDNAYAVLGISPTASDEEVKKAYREMAKKNHPDLVSNLGDEVREAAEKKFQEINAAYETIKKERGL